MANAGFIKHTNGQVLRSNKQQIVLNVFTYIRGKIPENIRNCHKNNSIFLTSAESQ
jgi:hypothetical protein